jgi:hypothetical protein
MKQFIHDWIHLTQGEMFIKYWHLWLFMVLIVLLISIVVVCWHDDIFKQNRDKQWQNGGFTTEEPITGEEAPYSNRMDNLSSKYLVQMVERDHVYSVLELAGRLPYTVMDVISEANRLGYSFDNLMQDPNKVMIDKK